MWISNISAGIPKHPSVPPIPIGVMLVNLGTPTAPNHTSVRQYLAQFLSDPRVIDLNPWLWKPVLHGIILRIRPGKIAKAYQKIWMQATNESPLRYYTRRQCEKIAARLFDLYDSVNAAWAMRYGDPSIPDTLIKLKERGCRRVLVAPLYPQYSATTTATVTDKVFETLKSWRHQPSIRIVPPYYDHATYIEALATSIKNYLSATQYRPDILIASFHGLPEEYVIAGDPYFSHCSKTTRLLREHLGMNATNLRMTFQSRFGPKKWLQPHTEHVLAELAKSGNEHVAVITPGFAADCLETLEEISMRNRDLFLASGGKQFDYIPCLNDSPLAIDLLMEIIQTELSGWI